MFSHISSSFFPTRKSVNTGIKMADKRPATNKFEIVNGMYVEIFIASDICCSKKISNNNFSYKTKYSIN